jgi:hypothetical protein
MDSKERTDKQKRKKRSSNFQKNKNEKELLKNICHNITEKYFHKKIKEEWIFIETKTEKKEKKGKLLYDYESNHEGDLSCKENDIINILEIYNDGWTNASMNDKIGLVPTDYFQIL